MQTHNPVILDIEGQVDEICPGFPGAQKRTVATWLSQGWSVIEIGRHGEVCMS